MDRKSKTYRFYNNAIEFSIEFHYLKNLKTGEVVKLPHLETKVFAVLIENANNVCEKQKLLDCWKNNNVSDNSLTRVVSVLRANLKKLGVNNVLNNQSKSGYILQTRVCEGPFNDDDQIAPKKETLIQGNYKSTIVISLILSLFFISAAASYNYLFGQGNESRNYRVKNRTPIFDVEENAQLQHPSISPSGKNLIYSKSDINNEHWYIEWLDVNTLEKQSYKHDSLNFATPVWKDENTFAYHAYSQDECEIRLATREEQQIVKDVMLHACSKETLAKSLSWKDSNTLYFTDSNSVTLPHNLFEINIHTLMLENVKNAEKFGRGLYGIFSNNSRDKFALLVNGDWESTEVEIYENGDFANKLTSFSVARPLFSVGWLNAQNIVYQNSSGGLSIFDIEADKSFHLSVAVDKYFSNPVSGGGKLAIINGPYYVSNIHFLSQHSDSHAEDIFRNFKRASHKAIYSNGEDTYFVSDRTGSDQIYLSQPDNHVMLSDFDELLSIRQLIINEEKQMAIITHQDGIDFYRFDKQQLKEHLFTWEGGKSTCWWQGDLIMVLVDNDIPNLHKIDNETFEATEQITSNGASHCSVDEEELFYSRYRSEGIWKYVEDAPDEHIYKISSSSKHNSWIINDDEIWYVSAEDGGLKHQKAYAEHDHSDVKNNVESVYKGIDGIYYASFGMSANEILLLEFD